MKLDVYLHSDGDTRAALVRVERLCATLLMEVRKMTGELDRLTTEVAEMVSVVDSAIALINGLAEKIRRCDATPEALAVLADSLDSKAGELGAAVAANTPAE